MDDEQNERTAEFTVINSRWRMSRRHFVRGTMAIGGLSAVQALLAACGGSSKNTPTTASVATSAASAAATTGSAATTAATAMPSAASGGATVAPSGSPAASGSTGTSSAPDTYNTSPNSKLPPQKLVYAGGQDAPTIDPSDRTDYSIGALTMQLYDRLFRYEGGWPQPIDPCLCTKYEASSDAKTWTFTLTDKAKFHDGSPVTSGAVQYSINRTLQMKKPQSDALLPIMDLNSVQIPDPQTVKITLTQPYSELPRALSLCIMNPTVVKAHEVSGDMGAAWLVDHEAGSGPFTIKSWTVGTAYELEAFEDYWQGWPGESRLSGFVWQIVRETTSQRIGLISKQFDVVDTISSDDVPLVNAQAQLNSAVNYGILTGYTKVNDQKEPTNDVNFRLFLAYAFDYQAFLKVINNYGQLLTGVIPKGIAYFDPSVGGYQTDLDKAKEYLSKTKWANGGTSLDFVYVTGLSYEQQVGEIWLSQLKQFNIKVNLIPKVWPDIVAGCVSPDKAPSMNMIFTGYNIPDQWYFYQWYSPNWDRQTGGDYNTCSFYKNPDFNKLVEQVRATSDETEKKQIYSQMQKIIHQDVPDIPIYVQPNLLGFQNRVQGYKYFGAISVDFWRLWIDDSKQNTKPSA
ncbi:MAG TPA: ABC transporter substrate-binding protein [Nitrolancea sp.]|nr:ABC transporter substrate-binding protein [Nitrolancea sp.]